MGCYHQRVCYNASKESMGGGIPTTPLLTFLPTACLLPGVRISDHGAKQGLNGEQAAG